MAIAYVASSKSGDKTSSPFTWSHTVAVGDNRMLVVGVIVSNNGFPTVQPTVTAVTYNGVSMTRARCDQRVTTFDKYESSVWLLHAPATGENTVSVTCSNLSHGVGFAANYSGVNQSSTADAVGGTSGSGSGMKTASVTTVEDNCWVVAALLASPSYGTPTHTTRQISTSGVIGFVEDTNAAITPAGTVAIGANLSSAVNDYAISACSFAPAAEAAAAKPATNVIWIG